MFLFFRYNFYFAGVLSTALENGQLGTEFSVTLDQMPTLDGKNIVFGKVIKGVEKLIQINDLGKKFGKPMLKIVISKCGIVKDKSTKP